MHVNASRTNAGKWLSPTMQRKEKLTKSPVESAGQARYAEQLSAERDKLFWKSDGTAHTWVPMFTEEFLFT